MLYGEGMGPCGPLVCALALNLFNPIAYKLHFLPSSYAAQHNIRRLLLVPSRNRKLSGSVYTVHCAVAGLKLSGTGNSVSLGVYYMRHQTTPEVERVPTLQLTVKYMSCHV